MATKTAKRTPTRAELGLKPIGSLNHGEYASEVGARILQLAEWREMSRMQLAGKAGLHVNAVNKMVNGLSDMRLSTLCSLATALDVPICELLP